MFGALVPKKRSKQGFDKFINYTCRPDQIQPELNRFLHMLKLVYDTFGLHYKMALSTRPQ